MSDQNFFLAGESFDLESAMKVIAGYCFGEAQSDAKLAGGDTYGIEAPTWRRRRWGYLSYDCQRGSGPPPDIVDVMAPVLLNVTQGYGVRLVSDLLALTPRVRSEVGKIKDSDFRFWHLEPGDIVPAGSPRAGSPSLALHRAWYLVESVPGAGVATTHKLLHHAWPGLFPLLDNRTIEKLGRDRAWVTILEDLKRHESEFTELEVWFEKLSQKHEGLPLTRLRLHDILLWCRISPGEEDEAARAGAEILRS